MMARRTAAQMAQTRADLIAAAQVCFAQKGLQATQVAEIAQGAGVGISAFYSQFKDKEALFLCILQDLFDEMHQGVRQIRRDVRLSNPLDTLLTTQHIYELIFETFYKHRSILLSAVRSGFASTRQLEPLYWQICDAVSEALTQDMQPARDLGLLQVSAPEHLADSMIGMVYQLAYRMACFDQPSPQEAARCCTKFTLGGLFMHMSPEAMARFMPLISTLSLHQTEAVSHALGASS